MACAHMAYEKPVLACSALTPRLSSLASSTGLTFSCWVRHGLAGLVAITDLESPVRRSCESCLQDSVFRTARSGATAAADQVSTVVVSTGQIALAATMPMKPLYAGLITAAAIVGAILICVGCRRCQCTLK